MRGGLDQGCIRREGTSEAETEAVKQAAGGGWQSGWGRLLSVTNAIEPGNRREGTVAGHRPGALEGEGGGTSPHPSNTSLGWTHSPPHPSTLKRRLPIPCHPTPLRRRPIPPAPHRPPSQSLVPPEDLVKLLAEASYRELKVDVPERCTSPFKTRDSINSDGSGATSSSRLRAADESVETLYAIGEAADCFTLVLAGRVQVWSPFGIGHRPLHKSVCCRVPFRRCSPEGAVETLDREQSLLSAIMPYWGARGGGGGGTTAETL